MPSTSLLDIALTASARSSARRSTWRPSSSSATASTRAPISSASASRCTRRSTASGRSRARPSASSSDERRARPDARRRREQRRAALAARDRWCAGSRSIPRSAGRRWTRCSTALGARSGARGAGWSRSRRRRSPSSAAARARRRGVHVATRPRCAAAAERELAGVWDAARRERGAAPRSRRPASRSPRDAFAAVDAQRSTTTRARWVAMRGDACEATRVRGEQSEELLDLRMACLQRRLARRAARSSTCSRPPTATSWRAPPKPRGSLPPLDACADTEALRAPVRPPADPKTRQRVDAAQQDARDRARAVAGRALRRAPRSCSRRSSPRRNVLGWRPLEGEVLLAAAQLADSTGDYPERGEARTRMPRSPPRPGATTRPPRSHAIGLVWVTGERLGKYAEAQDLARDAEAKVERVGHNDMLQRRPRSEDGGAARRARASTRKPSSAASTCSRSARRR